MTAQTLPGLQTTAKMAKDAFLSHCGRYRYYLVRRWSDGPVMLFVMLNPSTADATNDDPTIRRCIGFAQREGCGAVAVVNLFALRTPDPRQLLGVAQALGTETIIGRENDKHIATAVSMASVVVMAWGAHESRLFSDPENHHDRGHSVWRAVRHIHGKRTMCLGTTKAGAPKHPLYLAANTPLIPYGPH